MKKLAIIIAAIFSCAAATPPDPSTSVTFELVPGTPGKPGFKSYELPVYAAPEKTVSVAFKAKKPIHAGVSGGTDYGILAEATGTDISVRFRMTKFGEARIYVSSVDGSADIVEASVAGGSFERKKEPIQSSEPTAASGRGSP